MVFLLFHLCPQLNTLIEEELSVLLLGTCFFPLWHSWGHRIKRSQDSLSGYCPEATPGLASVGIQRDQTRLEIPSPDLHTESAGHVHSWCHCPHGAAFSAWGRSWCKLWKRPGHARHDPPAGSHDFATACGSGTISWRAGSGPQGIFCPPLI